MTKVFHLCYDAEKGKSHLRQQMAFGEKCVIDCTWPFEVLSAKGLFGIIYIITPLSENQEGVIYVIEKILSCYTSGQLSDGAAMMGIFIAHDGDLPDNLLAKKMRKSLRTIQRYRAELSNLSSCSSSFIINTTTNENQNNETIKDHVSCADKIGEILDKYGVGVLKITAISRLRELGREFNEKAFEYIVKECVYRKSEGRVRKLTPYFRACLDLMWEEALAETSELITNNNPLDGDMSEFTHTTANIPDSDPHAESIWTIVMQNIAVVANPSFVNTWLKSVIPIGINNNELILSVGSEFTKNWILNRCGTQLSNIIGQLGYKYSLVA